MSALGTELERRLGLKAIVKDNAETWTARTGSAGRRDARLAALWFYGVPAVPAGVLLIRHLRLQNIGQILSGVAVFTALLFGLLVLMFNTGVALRKDGSALSSAHQLRELVGSLRANTTYAALTAMALSVLLVVAAMSADQHGKAPWPFAPVAAYLFCHLGLMLLTILRGLRTAFNYITR